MVLEVSRANKGCFAAEIELITGKAQRLGMLERKLANAKESEQFAEAMKLGGRGLLANVLLATANRLAVEIEIEIEREKE